MFRMDPITTRPMFPENFPAAKRLDENEQAFLTLTSQVRRNLIESWVFEIILNRVLLKMAELILSF